MTLGPLVLAVALAGCAAGAVARDGTVQGVAIGQSRLVVCQAGGYVDSATCALIGPCSEIAGGVGSGGFYATLAAALSAVVAILAGTAVLGEL